MPEQMWLPKFESERDGNRLLIKISCWQQVFVTDYVWRHGRYVTPDGLHTDKALATNFAGVGTAVQSARAATDSAGLFVWTFPTPFAAGVVPHCWGVAEGPNPVAGTLVNLQLEGAPTNTQARFRVTKSTASLVSLLGLTILSIPAQVGVTQIDVFAKAPNFAPAVPQTDESNGKTKTFAEVRKEATAQARDQMLGEVCRVLRYHLDLEPAANALWAAYQSGERLRQRPIGQIWYDGLNIMTEGA